MSVLSFIGPGLPLARLLTSAASTSGGSSQVRPEGVDFDLRSAWSVMKVTTTGKATGSVRLDEPQARQISASVSPSISEPSSMT